tara:strand:+ start:288 stop:545 length:258 start_codon:yes stop_codon:yes gene_type:complete
VERKGISSGFGIWFAGWLYVFVWLEFGRWREWPTLDAQILGILCVLGAFPSFDVVFYERIAIYVEDNYLFFLGVLHSRSSNVEVI